MNDLLEGLEDFGFDNPNEIEAIKDMAKESAPKEAEKPKELTWKDCLFEKSHVCPVCDNNFKDHAVQLTKVRLEKVDEDLMPIHSPLYTFFYNVVICDECGFAALAQNFRGLTDKQCDNIKNEITPKFKKTAYALPYTCEIAVNRYKYALLNSAVKKGRLSEKAYICLVISWIYKLGSNERERVKFATQAYKWFVDAYSKEPFPMYGMNEATMSYLIAALASSIGEFEAAKRWTGSVITSRAATSKLKDMARDLRDKIKGLEVNTGSAV